MSKWRKKPIVVDATQWFKNGDHPEDDCRKIKTMGHEVEFLSEGKVVRGFRDSNDEYGDRVCDYCDEKMIEHGWIDTREGGHTVCPGDWIITDIRVEKDCHGYRYPCKPGVFMETYDGIEEELEEREEIIVINGVDINSLPETEEDINAETKSMKHFIVNASSDFSLNGNINDLRESLKEIFTQKIIDEIPDFDFKKYEDEGCKISVIVRTSFPPGVLDD